MAVPFQAGDFAWSEREYSMESFLAHFPAERLPAVICITDGTGLNEDSMHEFGNGEVYHISAYKRQARVLAVEDQHGGRCYGIPLDYAVPFNLKRRGSDMYTEPMLIKEIVEDYLLKTDEDDELVIFIADPVQHKKLTYTFEGEITGRITFPRMVLKRLHDTIYLMAHSIIDGKLCPVVSDELNELHSRLDRPIPNTEKGSLPIPTYLPIKFTIAVGLDNGNEDAYNKILTDLYTQCFHWNHQKSRVNTDIIMFGDEYTDDSGYIYQRFSPGKLPPKGGVDLNNIVSEDSVIYQGARSERKQKPLPPAPADDIDEDENEADVDEYEIVEFIDMAFRDIDKEEPKLNERMTIGTIKEEPAPTLPKRCPSNRNKKCGRERILPPQIEGNTLLPLKMEQEDPLPLAHVHNHKGPQRRNPPPPDAIGDYLIHEEIGLTNTGTTQGGGDQAQSLNSISVSSMSSDSMSSKNSNHHATPPPKTAKRSISCDSETASHTDPQFAYTLNRSLSCKNAPKIPPKPNPKAKQSCAEHQKNKATAVTDKSATNGTVYDTPILAERTTSAHTYTPPNLPESKDLVDNAHDRIKLARKGSGISQISVTSNVSENEYSDASSIGTASDMPLHQDECSTDNLNLDMVKVMSTQEVCQLLDRLKLSRYSKRFQEEEIDGNLLASLTNKREMVEILKDDLTMRGIDAHKMWMYVHKGWTPK